jgi:probable addiction module antidote protein
MAKTKTSKLRKGSRVNSIEDLPIVKLKPGVKTIPYSPTEELKNVDAIARALFQCLREGDTKAFKEILSGHLRAINISKLSREAKIPLRTIHEALSPKGNPSLNTLAKIIHGLAS